MPRLRACSTSPTPTSDSPFGPLLLAATPRGLVRVSLPDHDPEQALEELAAKVSPRVLEAPARLDEARRELDLYFEGKLTEFDLPLDWQLSKDFRRKVLRAIDRIPYGKTRSYTEIARSAGNERAVRAAGTACGSNPTPDRRPLPPRPAQRRRPRRLRRRPADEGGAAGAGGCPLEARRAEQLPRPLDHELGLLLGDEVPAALDYLDAHVVGIGLEAGEDVPPDHRVGLAGEESGRHRAALGAVVALFQARQLADEEAAVDVGGGERVVARAKALARSSRALPRSSASRGASRA